MPINPNTRLNQNTKIKIGLSGTGFIASGFFKLINNHPTYSISHVLSRRPIREFSNRDFGAAHSPGRFRFAGDFIHSAKRVGRPLE